MVYYTLFYLNEIGDLGITFDLVGSKQCIHLCNQKQSQRLILFYSNKETVPKETSKPFHFVNQKKMVIFHTILQILKCMNQLFDLGSEIISSPMFHCITVYNTACHPFCGLHRTLHHSVIKPVTRAVTLYSCPSSINQVSLNSS